MCAQLMQPDRPRWADDNTPTNAEAVSAISGFVSYCGRFELREDERAIIHRPETAWSPNWVGTSQRRPFQLVSADRFFFRGEEQGKAVGRERGYDSVDDYLGAAEVAIS